MRLTKHHGLGNDFLVLLDSTAPARSAGRRLARCATAIAASAPTACCGSRPGRRAVDELPTCTMRLFNADGGRAEMSGNGISCLAQAVVLAGIVAGPVVTVGDRRRPAHRAHRADRRQATSRATVDMGAAKVGDDESGVGMSTTSSAAVVSTSATRTSSSMCTTPE